MRRSGCGGADRARLPAQHRIQQCTPARARQGRQQDAQRAEEFLVRFESRPGFLPQNLEAVRHRVQTEGEQVQRGEHAGLARRAMAEVVLECLPEVGEAVEAFDVDLPARPQWAIPATFSSVTSRLVKNVL